MNQLMAFFFLMLCANAGKAQYQYDNSRFTNVFPQALCDSLKAYGDALLLDVRNPEEYGDSANNGVYNLGRLKEARNIPVSALAGRWKELEAFKDKPVFVYCSHSQRSRRASKMLADSGFTRVYNINGGMTGLYLWGMQEPNCLGSLIQTTQPYQLVAPTEICKILTGKDPAPVILDVRSDSAWYKRTSNPKINAMGYFQGSLHIPLIELEQRWHELPRDKRLVITDVSGDEAPRAAQLLAAKGIKNITVMMEGIDRWVLSDSASLSCARQFYRTLARFQIISSPDLANLLFTDAEIMVVDLRTAAEFNNKHDNPSRNVGRIMNALNIPLDSLEREIPALINFKTKPLVLYGYGGYPEVYKAANLLVAKGFTQVKVLAGGLFNMRWYAANVEGAAPLKELVVDVPEENL